MQIQRLLEIVKKDGKRAVIVDLDRQSEILVLLVVSNGKAEINLSKTDGLRGLNGEKLTFKRTFLGDTLPYTLNFFYGCSAVFCVLAWLLRITGRG